MAKRLHGRKEDESSCFVWINFSALFFFNPWIESLLSSCFNFSIFCWVFDCRFSSARELGNLIVTSNLIDSALTKILELQRDQTALLSSVQYRVFYPSPKCTIVAFVSSPDCTQNPLPGQGDLVPSPLFDFLCTEEYKSVSINRAALTLFTSLHDHLSELKTQVKIW